MPWNVAPKQPSQSVFPRPECNPPCSLVWTTRTGLGMWECQCPRFHFGEGDAELLDQARRLPLTPGSFVPPEPPHELVVVRPSPAFWQQSWFLVGAGLVGGFVAVKLLKKSRTTKNPQGERGRLLEQIDEAISRRDASTVGSIVDMLRFNYGLKHEQIFDMFKKAHPGLSKAQFDTLLEESEE